MGQYSEIDPNPQEISTTKKIHIEEWKSAETIIPEDFEKFSKFGSSGFIFNDKLYQTLEEIPVEIKKSNLDKIFKFEVSEMYVVIDTIEDCIDPNEVKQSEQTFGGKSDSKKVIHLFEKDYSRYVLIALVVIILLGIIYLGIMISE